MNTETTIVQQESPAAPTSPLPETSSAAASAAVPNSVLGNNLVAPPAEPTQEGVLGIRYDFNDGARIKIPKSKKPWRVELFDADGGQVLYRNDISDESWVLSAKKFHVRFGLRIWLPGQGKPLFEHVQDLADKEVLISFPVGTLGDLVGWLPYAERFRKKHGCRLTCAMGREIIDLFAASYPEIEFLTPAEAAGLKPYATYRVGLFFGGNQDYQPIDFRQVGLHRTAGHILGVDPTEEPPRLKLDAPRQIAEPYVCIAVQSSAQCKYWNNSTGWREVVAHLKARGYRVLCIDKHATWGSGYTWTHLPHGAEDFTGDRPLAERAALLQHADFFIGTSSGLSWLAWACRTPVVLISGFTLPTCEFGTPYRVFSPHGCNGCWDDVRENFDHKDFFWCPRHKGTDRQYECSRNITGQQVIGTVDRLIAERAPIDCAAQASRIPVEE